MSYLRHDGEKDEEKKKFGWISALNGGTIERNKSAGNRDDTEREGNDVRGSEIAQPYLRGADRRISLHIHR